MLISFWKKIWKLCTAWNVRVGCNPPVGSRPVYCSLPLYRATFCCGLAGILSIKVKSNEKDLDAPDERLLQCFARIREKDLKAVLNGSLPVSFLPGRSPLSGRDGKGRPAPEGKRRPAARPYASPRRCKASIPCWKNLEGFFQHGRGAIRRKRLLFFLYRRGTDQ